MMSRISLTIGLLVWAWHAPALHHAARHHTGVFVLDQAGFAGAGLGLWFSVVAYLADGLRLMRRLLRRTAIVPAPLL